MTPAACKVMAEVKIRLGWTWPLGKGRCLGVLTNHLLTTQPPACQGHQLTHLWWQWGVQATWKSQSLQDWPMESAQEVEHRKSFIPWNLQGKHQWGGHWVGGWERGKIFLFLRILYWFSFVHCSSSTVWACYFLRGIYCTNLYFSHYLSQVAKAKEINIASSPCYSWDNS